MDERSLSISLDDRIVIQKLQIGATGIKGLNWQYSGVWLVLEGFRCEEL